METINKDILSDHFRIEGMRLPNLKKDLEMMNETTKILEVTSSDLTLYSIVNMKKNAIWYKYFSRPLSMYTFTKY